MLTKQSKQPKFKIVTNIDSRKEDNDVGSKVEANNEVEQKRKLNKELRTAKKKANRIKKDQQGILAKATMKKDQEEEMNMVALFSKDGISLGLASFLELNFYQP